MSAPHRLVLVGAESSGKTTLAQALVARLHARGGDWARTRWVAEYGREYSLEKLAQRDPEWRSEEFETIAREQQRLEDEAARGGGPVLICDTDAFATEVWHERYLGARSAATIALAAAVPANRSYLLTAHREVPFEPDDIRDGERFRDWMHGVFAERLRAARWPWAELSGSLEARVERALAWIDSRLGAK